MDEYPDTFVETNSKIAPGQTINGLINADNDRDAFRLEVSMGTLLKIELDGARFQNLESRTGLITEANLDPVNIYTTRYVGGVSDGEAFLRVAAQGTTVPEDGMPYTLTVTAIAANMGTDGNDWLTLEPAKAADFSAGLLGNDTLSFVNMTHGVNIGRNNWVEALAEQIPSSAYVQLVNRPVQFAGFTGFTGTVYDDVFLPEVGGVLSDFDNAEPLRLRGLSGNDHFGLTLAPTLYDGGIGSDTVSYHTALSRLASDSTSVHISLLRNKGWGDFAEGDTYIDVENLRGSWGADFITGDRGANILEGMSGADTLMGNAGDDTLIGGDGPWYATGQVDIAVYNYDRAFYEITQNDDVWQVAYTGPGEGDGTDTVSGIKVLRFADVDLVIIGTTFYGGSTSVDYIGTVATDQVDYAGESPTINPLSASLLAGVGWSGDAAGDTYESIENLTGGYANDLLIGDHFENILVGQFGNDTLAGNGGNDTLYGGDGADVAIFSDDRDQYFVGEYATNTVVHHVNGPDGGGDGLDYLYEIEVLRFADGDVIL